MNEINIRIMYSKLNIKFENNPRLTYFYTNKVERKQKGDARCLVWCHGSLGEKKRKKKRSWKQVVNKCKYPITGKNVQRNFKNASAVNRTRGPSMATMDFTTKPLMLLLAEKCQDRMNTLPLKA